MFVVNTLLYTTGEVNLQDINKEGSLLEIFDLKYVKFKV